MQIEAVHQAQRLELVFGELAGKAALDLSAKLRDPFSDQCRVEFVIAIHQAASIGFMSSSRSMRAIHLRTDG